MSKSSEIGFATFSLENLALGLLMAEPKHGYQLYQDYEVHFLSIWRVGRSKFYAALTALHAAGYLAATTELQEDRPPRKIYQLTEAGRRHFLDWLYQPVTPIRAIRVEFLAKLRFFTLFHLPNPERLFDAQIAVCQALLTAWDSQKATQPPNDLVLDLVHDFRRRQVQLIVDWLQDCRARFDNHE